MSIASRHGKLFVSADDTGTKARRAEDLLTSDIFGAYRYLPVQIGVGRLLAAATNADGMSVRDWAAARAGIDWSHLTRLWLRFWPTLAGKEPDIVLVLGDQARPLVALLVEVKLHSEQHMIGGASQIGFYGNAFQEADFKDPPFDFDLPLLRPLVFITKHQDPPPGALQTARRELGGHVDDGKTDAFWVGWPHSLHFADAAIEDLVASDAPPHQLTILQDIVADLEDRGIRRLRSARAFSMPKLDRPLEAFPLNWLPYARARRRSFSDLGSVTLPRIDSALEAWRLR